MLYRIVFGIHKWQFVKGVQWFCERLDCIDIEYITVKCYILAASC